MRKPILLAILLFGSLLFVACRTDQPGGIPPLPSASAAPPTDVAVAATAASVPATVVTASPLVSATATLSVSVALTPTLPPSIVALSALRIRSGPGTDYPIIGDLAAGAEWSIDGRSADGEWWRIACPTGVTSAECWVTADTGLAQSLNATAVPLSAAPPLPLATSAPTPTPCIPSAGPDWVSYPVAAGDTLSSIAARAGVSVAQLLAANCLASDVIVAGSSLAVPAAGLVALPPTQPGAPSNGEPDEDFRLPSGVAAVISRPSNPNRGDCSLSVLIDNGILTDGDPASVRMIDRFGEDRAVWEAVEVVCIYVQDPRGELSPDDVVTITLPSGVTTSVPIASIVALGASTVGEAAFLVDTDRGEFRASIQLESAPPPATFTVKPASIPRIDVYPNQVEQGALVQVYLAGLARGQAIVLYGQRDNSDRPCQRLGATGDGPLADDFCYMRTLAGFIPSTNGVQLVEIDTSLLLPTGTYRVDVAGAPAASPDGVKIFSLGPG